MIKCVEDQVPISCAKSEGVCVKLWVVLLLTTTASLAKSGTVQSIPPQGNVIRAPVLPGTDIRFRKLSNPQSLSQVRVHSIVQDGQGFLWFGT